MGERAGMEETAGEGEGGERVGKGYGVGEWDRGEGEGACREKGRSLGGGGGMQVGERNTQERGKGVEGLRGTGEVKEADSREREE